MEDATMGQRDERTVLLVRVVRGEESLTALATVGIVPHFEGRSLIFENPHRLEAIVTIRDLATGLLAEHPEPGYTPATAYRRWAFAIMAWEFADLRLYDEDADELLPLEELVLDSLRTYAVEHESVTISAGNHVQLRKS